MIVPYWQLKHDWWIDDISFEIIDRNFYIDMLRMHPDDEVGAGYRQIIKILDLRIKNLRSEYKKIYGTYPKNDQIKAV